MKFTLDVHLGRLARDLRMLGFDSLWSQDVEDAELIEQARSEHRALLTRDRALAESAEQAGAEVLLVVSLEKDSQLLEVLKRFQLGETARAGRGFLTLCLQCNSPILPVKGHQIHDRVPGRLLLEHEEFFLCPRCERVYWRGSHFDRMKEWVEKLLSRT